MSGSGHTHISDVDLKALGLRRVDAYVHDELGVPSEGDGQKKAKTVAQRKKEERDRLIADQLDQFNIVMSVFPGKRDTIARAAAKIEEDAIQTAVEAVIADDPQVRELVLRVRDKPGGLDAATLALASPAAIERGLRTLSEDVAPLIDAVLNNESVQHILRLILDKDPGKSNKIFWIVETIAAQPEAERAVEIALTLPTAAYVGKNVLAWLEGRGWLAERIVRRLSASPSQT